MTSPLRAAFAEAGADFAAADGVECAMRVAGVEAEYRSVRQHVGLGDLPDLAHIRVTGEAARELLDGVVAGNIQHIFAVTEQTGEGTRSTAQQVRELSRMAEELRQSVSRFKIA